MDVHVAAGKIQSVFRGITARRRFANFMRSLRTLDAQAVIRCLQIVEEWHDGWSHLLYSLLVLVFLLVLVYFQFVEGAPGNTDFNNQIIAFALSADAQYSAVNVPLDLLAYVGGLLATVQSLAPAPTPAAQDASCTSMFDTYCSGAYLINDSRVPQCVTLNAGTGFIDAQNQILYAIFLTQTRRRTASCSVFEPYALPNGTSYRACVQDAEDDVYASDWCDANPGMCNTTALQGFAYVEQIPGYALALHGGGMDIPANATTCLLDTYATKQWLDYRTKMARVTAFFFNRNGNGRIGILQDSFTFSLGGMITTERVVGSVSIEGSESIVLGVNVCLILLVLGQIGLDVWLVWKRKIRIVSVKFLFFAAADVMIFSVCIIAFLWYADLNAYEPPQINSGLLGKPAAFFNAALGMRALSDEHQTFVTNAGFTIILVLMRILFQLHFHASLAIVTGTLGMASTALAHFAAVFVLCWVCFAVCGMLLLGPTQAAYRDMASALNELLFVAVQDWSVSRSIIFPGLGSQVELVYQALFLWAWIILALVCLFNVRFRFPPRPTRLGPLTPLRATHRGTRIDCRCHPGQRVPAPARRR